MDAKNLEEGKTGCNKTGTPTLTAVTIATATSTSSSCTQTPFTSLSIIPPDGQVIQHAIHGPPGMAAQYLHQMYAAQQQHFMLQTAALQQQQHPAHLQTLATIQQASVCQRQSPSSSSSSLIQPPNASPHTQAMLLGNRPTNCNQAQMYLRTQMLILTPAATVGPVQSDLPGVNSSSCLPISPQVQNLSLRTHLPRAQTPARGVILKPSTQSPIPPAASLSEMTTCALKTKQLSDTCAETGPSETTQVASGPQVNTAVYSPIHTHALIKQQLSYPPGQRMAHHQFVFHQAAGEASNQRQIQPIALRVVPQDDVSTPLALKNLTTSSSESQSQSDPSASSSLSPSSSSVISVFAPSFHTSVPAPRPPPLVAAPQRRTSFPQIQSHPPPPPPPLVLPRLTQNLPASIHRLSLHSVQALAVNSGQVLLTEQEVPVAEALLQMPYQNLPPPQTVAVDLKVHPVKQKGAPSSEPMSKVNEESSEETTDSPNPQGKGSSIHLPGSPEKSDAEKEIDSSSSQTMTRSTRVEESAQQSVTSISTSDPLSLSPSLLPPPVLLASVRGPSQPPSAPANLPESPDRTSHVLTHLVEGFVIREGLEPFPVGQSLYVERQASLPESQVMEANGDAAEDSPMDADQSDSSDSEMETDESAADELEENTDDVLLCEFCGGKGHAHTFLRSKRFCSMTCVRRYNVSSTRRVLMQRAAWWGHRPTGRRGRPPSRMNGISREKFLRQGSLGPEKKSLFLQESQQEEEKHFVPMTTRLRKQAERERERESEQKTTETIVITDQEEETDCPSEWDVQQVFAYFNGLPGGADIAGQFRSQEIDGQALLLLTEDHLVSSMNLKLGPALKLCAHINSLKET